MKKPSCFGFVREIPEVLKSNLSNLHFRGKNPTAVSGDTEKETEHPTDDQKTIEESENTVGSSINCSLKTVLELYQQRAHNLRVFSVSELKTATNNFAPDLKIGEGGFGSVYSGSIKPTDGSEDEILVAVKCLNKHGLQGHKEWVAEVKLLGIADHPNVVKLIGYCAVDGERGIQRFLVYEFMPNKSLEIHLFNKGSPVLPWDKRLQVAFCTARGLAYLHEELEVQVIFRDFKSSNILLDLNFNPKLSDFGLAREGPSGGCTHVTTLIVGTTGYAAPEYIRTGHLTYKSDVWSFGVVLYELLTGRRSIENNAPRHERKLLEWVKHYPADNRKFHKIVDPRLGNRYSLVAAKRMAKLADSCLVKYPKIRPEMSKVVEILHEIMEISKSGDSQNLIVQHVNLDSFESDEKGHKQREPLCQDGSPDVAGARTSRRRLRKENGHAFNRRRLVVMSKEQWEASQQNLQQQCRMQKHHERHQNQSQQ